MAGVNGNNSDDWIAKIIGDVSKESACKQLAIGTASGWVTGFVAMKVGKTVALLVGGSIIVLQVAQHKGYIKINWDKVERQADKVIDRLDANNPQSKIDKLERYVDRKLDKASDILNAKQKKARRWFDSFLNNGNRSGYDLQELHIFILSFGVGAALGLATA